MARVVIQAVVSVDGYIAYPDDTVGPLFDWYGNGDVTVHANEQWAFQVSRASAEYVKHFPSGKLPARHTARFGVPTAAKVAFACIALGPDAPRG